MSNPAASRETIHRGQGVSGGVAIGKALVLGESRAEPGRRTIEPTEVDAELHRLTEALGATRRDLTEIQRRVTQAMGAQEAGIFDAHLLVLEDPMLLQQIHGRIRNHHDNAEHAVFDTISQYAAALAGVDDDYLRERAADVRDIGHRIVSHLLGVAGDHDLRQLQEPAILFAHDLSPGTTALLDRTQVLALVTETGGSTSHTAILARKLGLPATVGVSNITRQVRTGDYVLVDGFGGRVIVNPTDQSLFEYGQLKQRRSQLQEKLRLLRDQPAVTLDGERLVLAANIDQPEDVEPVRAAGAEGVGLFRSEFLFLNRADPPGEEEQYQAYRAAVEGLAPFPVVIRTLDLGGDKLPAPLTRTGEPNPFLGWRAIRICLTRPDLFKPQLRALLRAAVHGNLKILLPMISSVEEVREALAILDACAAELEREGVPHRRQVEVGVMIEIPAAALIAPKLARLVDFFSIGSNDLTGYTLAVDRLNERVASLFAPSHPAVLQLIRMTVEAARAHGRWVGVCGEAAGDPVLVPLLVGLGVTELSASPSVLPAVKFLLRRLRREEAAGLATRALECETAGEVLEHSRAYARGIAPELFT